MHCIIIGISILLAECWPILDFVVGKGSLLIRIDGDVTNNAHTRQSCLGFEWVVVHSVDIIWGVNVRREVCIRMECTWSEGRRKDNG